MSTARPRMRLAPEERAAQIYDAALAIASESGLSALTLRAIATRASVATGLVSHYEPSIDELVARVFTDITAAELTELHARIEILSGATTQMRTLIAALLAEARDEVTLAWVEAYALGRRNPALADAVHEQMQAWVTFVAAIIQDGVTEGSFTVSDAEDAAWQLIGMIDGLNAQALLRRSDDQPYLAQMARASEAILGAAKGSLV